MPVQQRRDGVVERILVKQTHTKDGKRPLKKEKVTETFRPHCAQPIIYPRNLEQIEGKRVDRRPSQKARKQGKKRITQCEWADDVGVDGGWSDDEQMPDEYAEADCGWRAGPIERELPAFNGPTPGPTNEDLEWSSSYTDVMDELITPEFVDKWIEYTVAHAEAWREEHPGCETTRIEQTMKKPRRELTPDVFFLWQACKVRCAQFKPEIDVSWLWDSSKSIYDVEVHRAMPYERFLWINRHAAFASRAAATATDGDDDEDDGEEGEGEEDDDADDADEEEETVAAARRRMTTTMTTARRRRARRPRSARRTSPRASTGTAGGAS